MEDPVDRPSPANNKPRTILVLGLLLIAGEVGLRWARPGLGRQPRIPESEGRQVVPGVGTEYRPHARIVASTVDGPLVVSQLNSEGFHGPERTPTPGLGVVRLLGVGDSVVEGLNLVPSGQTGWVVEPPWTARLEGRLNEGPGAVRYEVINAGMGGHTSGETAHRLETRGLKYHPEIVIVLVGWNDLLFSAAPTDPAGSPGAQAPPRTWWRKSGEHMGRQAYRSLYVVRAAREVIRSVRARTRIAGPAPSFDEAALKRFLANLERIRERTQATGARMVLVLWPFLFGPGDLERPERLEQKARPVEAIEPRQLLDWYLRYQDAQRAFAARHDGVTLIDPGPDFLGRPWEERLALFDDVLHLTGAGRKLLAEVVAREIRRTIGGRVDSRDRPDLLD